jgi:hypothetical protein
LYEVNHPDAMMAPARAAAPNQRCQLEQRYQPNQNRRQHEILEAVLQNQTQILRDLAEIKQVVGLHSVRNIPDNQQPTTSQQQQIQEKSPRMVELDEDLFHDAPQDASLAHCVGGDFIMGKGLAVEMRQRFCPDPVLKFLRSRRWQPGQVVSIPLSIDGRITRYIFHMVTKPFSRNCLPRRHELRRTIRELARQCYVNKVPVLAMPEIGAGLDRQPWQWVKRVILQEFKGQNIDILVYRRPGEGPNAQRSEWKRQRKSAANSQPPTTIELETASSFDPLLGEQCDEETTPKSLCTREDSSEQPESGTVMNNLKPPQSPSLRLTSDLEKMAARREASRAGESKPESQTELGAALNGANVFSAHQGGAIGRVGEETKAIAPSASGPTRQGEFVSLCNKADVLDETNGSIVAPINVTPVSSLTNLESSSSTDILQHGPGAALNGATVLSTCQGGVNERVVKESGKPPPSTSDPTRQGESENIQLADVSAETERSVLMSPDELIDSSQLDNPSSKERDLEKVVKKGLSRVITPTPSTQFTFNKTKNTQSKWTVKKK